MPPARLRVGLWREVAAIWCHPRLAHTSNLRRAGKSEAQANETEEPARRPRSAAGRSTENTCRTVSGVKRQVNMRKKSGQRFYHEPQNARSADILLRSNSGRPGGARITELLRICVEVLYCVTSCHMGQRLAQPLSGPWAELPPPGGPGSIGIFSGAISVVFGIVVFVPSL